MKWKIIILRINYEKIMKRVKIAGKVVPLYFAPNLKVLNVRAEVGFSASLPDLEIEGGESWNDIERN